MPADPPRTAYFLPGADPDAWPYSEALRVGEWVFIAGQGPVAPQTQQAVLGSIESETRLVLEHTRALLELAGSSLAEVVKVTVHLADIADFAAYNAVYREYFSSSPRPTRITVQSGLWGGIKIELECTAYSPQAAAGASR
ncbi:MAG: RidA family protein [Fimbriimonadaceae bacterium]|nr:RidA family protein [Fimbriimonadaceae bacterium]